MSERAEKRPLWSSSTGSLSAPAEALIPVTQPKGPRFLKMSFAIEIYILVLTVQHILALNAFNALCHKTSERLQFSVHCALFPSGMWEWSAAVWLHTLYDLHCWSLLTPAPMLTWKAHLRAQTPPDITHLIFIWRTCFSFLLHFSFLKSIFAVYLRMKNKR